MVKLAFLISAHTDAPHLKRLINVLPESADFYVHIDMKSDISQFTQIITESNVHFIEHRVNVVWGSVNEVEYQIELVRAAINSGTKYDFMITLSGMDYPVWSNERILEYFDQHKGREILQGLQVTESDERGSRLYKEYRVLSSHHWPNGTLKNKMRVGLRKLIKLLGFKKPLHFTVDGKRYNLYKGAAWWAISPELGALNVKFWENEDFKSYFKTSFGTAETFWQTVAFNSEFADRCILTEGNFTTLQALTPFTFIDYSAGVKILDITRYDEIIASGKMFCRKTVTGKSDALMDRFDADRNKA